tara:strand:- start:227 stop:412 length:186 start_codon:yes stop_codon:yes gene_type:complete
LLTAYFAAVGLVEKPEGLKRPHLNVDIPKLVTHYGQEFREANLALLVFIQVLDILMDLLVS